MDKGHRVQQDNRGRVALLYKNAYRPADATARVVHDLARCLAEAGYDATVHGMKHGHPHRRPPVGGPLARLRYLAGKVADQWAEWRFIIGVGLAMGDQSDGPDVVISVDYPTGVGFAADIARLKGNKRIRSIAWVMDNYQDQKLLRKSSLEAHLRRRLDDVTIRRADTVVTIGTCMAEHIRRRTGRHAEVIPVWAHVPSRPVSDHERTAVRDRWGLRDEVVVLYSGHAAAHHPLESLAAAAESLADHPDLRFVVSGVGVELERLRRSPRIAALPTWQFGNQVPDDQVDALLDAGDVHVVSLAEDATGTCVPSKTYAAMVRGKAVLFLGSPAGQAARDVLDSGAGIVVPTDEPSAVRVALLTLADPDTRRVMGAAGSAWAQQHRVLTALGQHWITLVDRALATGRPRPAPAAWHTAA